MPSLAAAQSVSDQAKKLQSSSIVIDTHDDTTQRLLDPKFDLSSATTTATSTSPA